MLHKSHREPARRAMAIFVLGVFSAIGGCLPTKGVAFRDAALPALETGVNSILNGIVSGVFAAIAVDPLSDSNGSGNSASGRR